MSGAALPKSAAIEDAFAAAVLEGLRAPQKRIESKWLYDTVGSRLFEAITALDSYYPTRTEMALLRARAAELKPLLTDDTVLVELGSGSSVKARILLDALPALTGYVPIDVSEGFLRREAAQVASDYPRVAVEPIVGDFTAALRLSPSIDTRAKLLFFPGSTIGNFDPEAARELLCRWRGFGQLRALVIGVDCPKDTRVLREAYDDPAGVTAAFNCNLLCRINRELGADFVLSAFRHEARWAAAESRMEMHLVSMNAQTVRLLGERVAFEEGETIHTENSYKYTPDAFRSLAAATGWHALDLWQDKQELFAVYLLLPAEDG